MAGEKVTLRDVYDAMERVEGKMDRRMAAIEEDVDKLKSFQNKALGVMVVFAAFTSAVASFIWTRITGQT